MLLLLLLSLSKVHELSTAVYQIRGHIKGKTLLPFPQQGAKCIEEEEAKVKQFKVMMNQHVLNKLNVLAGEEEWRRRVRHDPEEQH